MHVIKEAACFYFGIWAARFNNVLRLFFWRLNKLTVGLPSTREEVAYAEVNVKLDWHKLTLVPHLIADYTIGKKSAKAAEKTVQAPFVPATDPVCRISQGRLPCNTAATSTLPASADFPRAESEWCTYVSPPPTGDVEKAVTELIIDFDVNPEEESPYEALYNATSCHSLDSLASGRSSDRESVNKEVESTGLKAAGVRPVCSYVCSSLLALEG